MRKVVVVLLILSLTIILLTACAGSSSGGPSSDAGLVGISMPTRIVERWIFEGDFMKEALEAEGFEVDLQFANDQIMDQVAQIENMITNGAKFLIICPIDGTTLSAPLAKAKENDAYVLSYDRLIEGTPDVDFFAAFDSPSIGNQLGKSLMEGIGAANATPDNPLFIELFAGSLDDSETIFYFEGAMEMIQPYLDSGAVVVKSNQVTLEQTATPGWDGLVAQNRMQNLLSAHYTTDTIAGVLSPYDGLSLGIISAFRAVGYGADDKPMPIVTGQDCERPSLISIWNNEQYSSIFLDFPLVAGRVVEITLATLRGETVSMDMTRNNGAADIATFIVAANVITKENIPEFFFDRGTLTEEDLQLQ